jgi:RimJ/RimL family protein N-acetyltransferase
MLMASRITIGPFVPEDFSPVFCWLNDVGAARLDLAYRPVDMMTHQQWWHGLGKDLTKVVFAVRKTTEPTIIGYVQITGINSVHRSAEIGIRIGEEKHRGQGYGKEALRLAVDFCWNHLNLNRVQLIVFKHNERAVRAYKAVGFRKEGLLRKAAFIGGDWVDVILMAALRPAQRRERVPRPRTSFRRPGPSLRPRIPSPHSAWNPAGNALNVLPRTAALNAPAVHWWIA